MRPIFFLVAIMLSGILNAQPSDYYNRMKYIFENIDKSKVNTGLLKEFGIRFNDVESYNGVIDVTNFVDELQWQSLYSSLNTMRIGTTTSMVPISTVMTNIEIQKQNYINTILLSTLSYEYNQYKVGARKRGEVLVLNDKIIDISGKNPYDVKNAFGVMFTEEYLSGNSFQFRLPSGLIYSNVSTSLNSVYVDFDNGSGYQLFSLDNTIVVYYNSGGEKEIKYKFMYSDGSVLYSHSKVYLDYYSPAARYAGTNILNGWNERRIEGAQYNGAAAAGLITIDLASVHTVLTKPLIIVEGFDPDTSVNYIDFIRSRTFTDLELPIGSSTLNNLIEVEEYDIVYVDYENSLDYIQRNAYMLEAVIDSVNALKQGSPGNQNVVLGISMGGLVARYALSHMESQYSMIYII